MTIQSSRQTSIRKTVASPETIRDRLWLWGHESGSHNEGVGASSRITPCEAALYMGIPNVILVRYQNLPKPPFRQYALPFSCLREVVWSIVGDSSTTTNDQQTPGQLHL